MKTMTISPDFIFGSGTGLYDLYPLNVSLYEALGEDSSLNENMLLYSGEHDVTEFETDEYSQRVDLYINPGYFYIGDRECYAFHNKYTQVSLAVPSGECLVIPLQELPDGIGPLRYTDLADMPWNHETYSGASPIIVRAGYSGEMAALGVPFDTIISSENGIYSGCMGYRCHEDGTVISGEADPYPWYFSPLERFAKCGEYWRNEPLLRTDEYYYDMFTNSIVVTGDYSQDIEYVVEFEGDNSPFRIDVNFSPIVTYPENSIICLSPIEDTVSEYPARINIYADREPEHESMEIQVEVFSNLHNRMKNTAVDIYLSRDDFQIYPASLMPAHLEGYPFHYSGDIYYDAIPLPLGNVRERDIIISSLARTQGLLYTHAAGYLSSGDDTGYHVQAITDDHGICHVTYTQPRNRYGLNCSITACAGEATAVHTMYTRSTIAEHHRYASSGLAPAEYEYTVPVYHDGVGYIRIPGACITPSSIGIAPVSSFLTAVVSGEPFSLLYPDEIEYYSGCLCARYDSCMSGEPYMMTYPTYINTTILDERDGYEHI